MNSFDKLTIVAKSALGPMPLFFHNLIDNCITEAMYTCSNQPDFIIYKRACKNFKRSLKFFSIKKLHKLYKIKYHFTSKNDFIKFILLKHRNTIFRVTMMKIERAKIHENSNIRRFN